MAVKKSVDKKLVTPFRISVALNIVLGIIVLTVVSLAGFAYHEYKNGTDRAIRFALSFNGIDYYCNQANEKKDAWLANRAVEQGEPFTKDEAKRIKLLIESQCITPEFEPYYNNAMKQFFKDNGLKYEVE